MTGISRTLYHWLDEWELPCDIYYSDISDKDLDRLVRAVKAENPTSEEVLLMFQLHIRGITV